MAQPGITGKGAVAVTSGNRTYGSGSGTALSLLILSHNDLSGSHYSLKNTVGELSGSHYSLKGTVNELSGSHYSLKGTVNELSGSHYSLKNTVNELSGSHYSLKDTVNELSGSHYSLKATVSELSGSHYALKGTVNELSGSHYSLKNTVGELSGSHYSLKNTVGELSGSHYSLKSTVGELSGSHYSLKNTVGELSGSHYSLKNTVGELSGSHYSLKSTVGELSGSHYSLKNSVGELSGSHYSLKNSVSELSGSHYSLKSTVGELSGSHYSLKNTVGELSGSHYSLKNTVGELSGSHYSLKSTVGELSGSHYSLKNTVGELSGSHYSLKNSVSELSGSHYSLKNSVSELSGSHYSLKNSVSELSGSHYSLKNSVSELSGSHYSLKSTVGELSGSHYSLKSTVGELSGSHYSLKNTVGELSGSHYSLKNTVGELSGSHYSLKSTVGELSGSHYSLKSTVGELSGSHYSLKSTVGELSGSHYSLKNSVGELSGSHYSLKNSVSELSGSHYSLKNSVSELSGSHYSLKNSVNDLSTNNNIRFNNIDSSLGQVYTKTESDTLYVNKSNIDLSNLSTNIIPSTNNEFILGDVSKNWRNAYIKDISATNIDISNKLNVLGPTQLANTLKVTGNVTLDCSTLYVPAEFTIDPYGHGVNTGTLFINGNLTVQGLTTTINSSVVDISDKRIVLASNAKNSIEATDAGFEISGANVNFIYDYPSSAFRSSIGISVSGNVVPATNSVVSLGESGKIWDIAYIRELNVTNFTNSIDGANITHGTISSTQIANGSILTVDICDHAITYEKIAANAVTNTRIANGAVTHAKLSSDCIQSHNIVDGTIMDVDISANAGISGSKLANDSITSDKINQSNNWTFSQLTSNNAYIRDVSVTNITVSGNIIPLDTSMSDLGSLSKRWRNIYANDISINTINGQAYNAAPSLTSVSGNIIPSTNNQFKLGDVSRNWSNAYIRDISATNTTTNSLNIDGIINLVKHNETISKYIQIGQDLDGEYAHNGALSGWSVSLNNTGDILAIGARRNNGDAVWPYVAGHVKIYKYIDASWIQLGEDINGTIPKEQLGYSVSLNNAGNIIAIGVPSFESTLNGLVKLYIYNDVSWVQLGRDISGEASGDLFGYAVSLNGIGNIVAIYAPSADGVNGANTGHTRIYKYIDNDWIKLGEDIDGTFESGNYEGELNANISLNTLGNIVAIGGVRANNSRGEVKVYKYNDISWIQQSGNILNGEATSNFFGWSVSLNSSGNILAVGAIYNSGITGNNSGHVRVFKYNDISWIQIGQDIDGEAADNFSGNSVSLNDEGNIVAIGARVNNNGTGHVRVYKYNDVSWVQYGVDIDGEALGDNFGQSVSLNSTGNILAVGAHTNDGNGNNSGSVRVYKFFDILVESKVISSNIVPFTNNIYTLGTSSLQWKNAYINDLNIGNNLQVIGDLDIFNNLNVINEINVGGTITSQTIQSLGMISSHFINVTEDVEVLGSLYFTNGILSENGNISIINGSIQSNNLYVNNELIPFTNNSGTIGTTTTNWSNAYIRNISTSNISVSGNIIPLDTSMSDLGSLSKRWRNIYANDISVNTINGQAYNAAPSLTSVSGDIIPSSDNTFKLGDISRNWSNAYIRDISVTNISVSGNIVPLDTSRSDLGSLSRRWNNIYANDISINTINGQAYNAAPNLTSVSGNIIPSVSNQFKLGDVSRNWSNAYIRDISASNISISGNIIFSVSGSSLINLNQLSLNQLNVNNIMPLILENSASATGGSITTSNEYVYHMFTSVGNDTFIPQSNLLIDVLIVGGGGRSGGGWAGGIGGLGGQVIYIQQASVSSSVSYSVTVGAGGNNSIANGGNSSFFESTAQGGLNGTAVGTYDIPNNGTINNILGPNYYWGGGGDNEGENNWGYGGAGGGGGGAHFGLGGTGGINPGANATTIGGNGGINTGGGGGSPNGLGGSGIVIIRYIKVSTNNTFLGTSLQRWNNIYANDLSVNTINGQAYNAAPSLTSVSGDIIPFSDVNFSLGDVSRNWRNAYIRDISATNISISGNFILNIGGTMSDITDTFNNLGNTFNDITTSISNIDFKVIDLSNNKANSANPTFSGVISVSGNILPLTPLTGNLGTSSNPWGNANIRDLSIGSIDVGINLNPSITNNGTIGTASKIWGNAYIRDISASNISISGNIIPLFDISSDLGSETSKWRNIYVNDLSVNRINGFVYSAGGGGGGTAIDLTSVSGDIIPSINNTFTLGTSSNAWSNLFTNKLSPLSTNYYITTTNRIFQEINSDISSNRVNGYYGLAKDAYNSLNPNSSGIKAISNWTRRSHTENGGVGRVAWSPELGLFAVVGPGTYASGNNALVRVMTSSDGVTWTTRTTPSTNNFWRCICWSPELKKFVALTDGSTSGVISSTDGITWTPSSITNFSWQDVCWSRELSLFVAVGGSGKIANSSDGVTWATNITGPNNTVSHSWKSICWSAELRIFVAVADYSFGVAPRIMTSTNGSYWLPRNPSNLNSYSWRSVCWSPELSLFVAVANSVNLDRVLTSPDGITWSKRNASIASEWNACVCWCAELKLFVSVGQNSIMTSNNGINWTTTQTYADIRYWHTICWSPELGICVASGGDSGFRVMTSSLKGRPPTSYNVFDSSFNSIDENGNWTFQNITTNSRLYQNISGGINDPSWTAVNGYYGLAKDAYPSLNPLSSSAKAVKTWRASTLSVDSNSYFSLCWSPELGIFVAVALNGTVNRVMYSTNGINWIGVSQGVQSYSWRSVCWSPQLRRFAAISYNGQSMYSSSGTVWVESTQAPPGGAGWQNAICWSPELGIFLAVSDFQNSVATSNDGITWSLTSLPFTGTWNTVCWSPELKLFVAVALNGTNRIMISNNGITWSVITVNSSLDSSWMSICWSKELGLFVVVAESGTNRIMTSNNGTTWRAVFIPYDQNWISVCWSSELSMFVAVSHSNGSIMTSTNGLNWNFIIATNAINIRSICWSPELGIFAIVGFRTSSSSLKARPPTSYNVFDSSFNSIDENGNWTFQNISISGNIVPLDASRSDLGSSLRRWRNIYANDLSVNTINGQVYSAGGGLTANSVNSSHIQNGSILTEDICNNAITGSKIAVGTITSSNIVDGTILGTDICDNTITGNKIAIGTITSSNIADRTILGTDISLGQIGEAHFDASLITLLGEFGDALNAIGVEGAITSYNIALGTIIFDNLNSALRSRVLGSTGTFEITNDASGALGFNASFYYEEDGDSIYLFQDEVCALGTTKYIPYYVPSHFPTITFFLEIDANIDSYSLTCTPPVNGMVNHSKVGDRLITFQIGRNIQNYLEVNILTYTGFYGTLTVNNLPGTNGGKYLDYQWIVNGSPLNSITRINANGAPSSITILQDNRLQDINAQLTLNVSLEANAVLTAYSFNNNLVTQVSGSQLQPIFTANSNNLNNGTIVVNYTVNTYVPPPSNTGFNGNITVSQDGPAWQMSIRVYADGTERFNQAPSNFTSITFSIGAQLLSESSYLYMRVFPYGSYGVYGQGFSTVGVSFIGYETINGVGYEKYTVSSTLTNATLIYNISTFDDD